MAEVEAAHVEAVEEAAHNLARVKAMSERLQETGEGRKAAERQVVDLQAHLIVLEEQIAQHNEGKGKVEAELEAKVKEVSRPAAVGVAPAEQ